MFKAVLVEKEYQEFVFDRADYQQKLVEPKPVLLEIKSGDYFRRWWCNLKISPGV